VNLPLTMSSDANYNRSEILVGIFVVIGILYLIYVAIGLGIGNLPGMGGYVLHADFVSASGLNVGDPVEIAGVKVGTVESVSLADYQARVAFRIKDTVEVYDDASASIEIEGLIGDRSISIDPGTSGNKPLGPGDEIKDTESPLSLTELLGKWLTGDLTSGG
jgi:phospholipid/cholesterol/gamma-HCH transport system substrate-binding protein